MSKKEQAKTILKDQVKCGKNAVHALFQDAENLFSSVFEEFNYLDGKLEGLLGKETYKVFEDKRDMLLNQYDCNVDNFNQDQSGEVDVIDVVAKSLSCIGISEIVSLEVLDQLLSN